MTDFDLQALLADAAEHLADRVNEDCDVRYVSTGLRSVLQRWIARKMPRSELLEAALRRQSRLIEEPNRTPRWDPRDPGNEVTRSDDDRRRLAAGIAAAWANYRAGPSSPPQRIALQEESEEEGHTIFWSVEAALKDRLENGYVTATIRPCAIAFPRSQDMSVVEDTIIDAVNDAESASEWCDFSNQHEEIVNIEGTASQRRALEQDLDAMLANTFRSWAEKHHCQVAFGKRPTPCVEICAWKFTGPPRYFEYNGTAWQEFK